MPEPSHHLAFTYAAQPVRVVFGAGSHASVGEEADRLGLARLLVLCTPGREKDAEGIAGLLGARAVGVHPRARMHVPVEDAHRAVAAARHAAADGCIAVGGGSAVGLGKAVAVESGLPLLAVPTTYSGSEMTPVWGTTEQGVKRTGRDARALPRSVLYDPGLTTGLPVETSGTSAMNALAHAVEALYAPDRSPVAALLAREGIGAIAEALPLLPAVPGDVDLRTRLLYGAWLCGSCLGSTTMGLHHKLCHVLGGLGLPHAATHTVLLPYTVAFNTPAAPNAMATLTTALQSAAPAASTAAPAQLLQVLARRFGAPESLHGIGMRREDLERAAELAGHGSYPNPREAGAGRLRALLEDAFHGRPPGDY